MRGRGQMSSGWQAHMAWKLCQQTCIRTPWAGPAKHFLPEARQSFPGSAGGPANQDGNVNRTSGSVPAPMRRQTRDGPRCPPGRPRPRLLFRRFLWWCLCAELSCAADNVIRGASHRCLPVPFGQTDAPVLVDGPAPFAIPRPVFLGARFARSRRVQSLDRSGTRPWTGKRYFLHNVDPMRAIEGNGACSFSCKRGLCRMQGPWHSAPIARNGRNQKRPGKTGKRSYVIPLT